MKLIRKKRVAIDNFESLKNKKGIIFVSNNFTNYNSRDIKLNKTTIYSKNGFYIDLINNKGKITNITLSNNYDLCKDNILNIIDIYKGKLYIVILKSGTIIPDFDTNTYLDMFKLSSESIYYDIFIYNKRNYSNCYLNKILNDKKSFFTIKIFNLYYFLIGYL
tara:strand:- start:786 stop:1274 length:489 start_codon:yes stop_codon:yes gene_type:complete